MDWIDPAWDRDKLRDVFKVVINLRAPYNAGKFLIGYTTSGLSSSAQLHRVS
jgi:hypothetical protein